jgi:hypothetical protein
MAIKKITVSFDTVNNGNFTVIKNSDIAGTNRRVKAVMKNVVRDYKKKEILSHQSAALLVLNA